MLEVPIYDPFSKIDTDVITKNSRLIVKVLLQIGEKFEFCNLPTGHILEQNLEINTDIYLHSVE